MVSLVQFHDTEILSRQVIKSKGKFKNTCVNDKVEVFVRLTHSLKALFQTWPVRMLIGLGENP